MLCCAQTNTTGSRPTTGGTQVTKQVRKVVEKRTATPTVQGERRIGQQQLPPRLPTGEKKQVSVVFKGFCFALHCLLACLGV